jgi:ACS family glucarate transporter-like MFS transporter
MSAASAAVIVLRFAVGLAESPAFPANAKVVADGILGGYVSDTLVRRGASLTFARKTPIVASMLLSVSVVTCSYVDSAWLVVARMALAFFGKGMGALRWAVVADVAAKEAIGIAGSIFNMFGDLAGIVTPIIIGDIVATTDSFNGALVFVGAMRS